MQASSSSFFSDTSDKPCYLLSAAEASHGHSKAAVWCGVKPECCKTARAAGSRSTNETLRSRNASSSAAVLPRRTAVRCGERKRRETERARPPRAPFCLFASFLYFFSSSFLSLSLHSLSLLCLCRSLLLHLFQVHTRRRHGSQLRV